jgi:hypothetical protein
VPFWPSRSSLDLDFIHLELTGRRSAFGLQVLDRPVRVVGGLITGWHDAGASHLLLLEALAGPDLVTTACQEAVEHGYLWHKFGESALLLPELRTH